MEDGSHIARYMEHQQRLVACCFHPSDQFKLITVSDELTRDFSIHVWDYRQHPFRKNLPKIAKPSDQTSVPPVKAASDSKVPEKDMNGTKEHNNDEEGEGLVVKNQGEIHNIASVGKPATKTKSKSKSKRKNNSGALLPITSNALINAKHSICDELRYIVDKIPFQPEKKEENEVEGADESVIDPMLHLGLLGSVDDCIQQIKVERTYKKNIYNYSYPLYFLPNVIFLF